RKVHARAVQALAYSPDGRRLATATQDGTVLLWRLDREGDPPTTLALGRPGRAPAFSPDGGGPAPGTQEGRGGGAAFWDPAGERGGGAAGKLGAGVGPPDRVRSLAFAPPDSGRGPRLLASASRDGTVMVWEEVGRGEPYRLERARRSAAEGLAFAPDGTLAI